MVERAVGARVWSWLWPLVWCSACALGALACAASAAAAQSLLSFKYTPAPRAQLAIWIEDGSGRFLATVALTEAVAYRGIGNRPGASNMNSGYRWPYGRREGVLPVWAHRRASAPGAQLFSRVIFQNRSEGFASRTVSDQSPDSYYCLQFDQKKSARDQLDAVSCATPFSSDKGRYLTEQDVAMGYGEPFEAEKAAGTKQPLALRSYYPPRMDVTRCQASGCYDHADIDRYAADARAVLPEIDAISIATPKGDEAQSLLFSVPRDWPSGDYAAFIEVNTEGDYNAGWNEQSLPTPQTPSDAWDYYALNYGYAYRGQPSVVWKVRFSLAPNGQLRAATSEPVGRASWDYYREGYGELTPLSDAPGLSTSAAYSGVQRLRANAAGERFVVESRQGGTAPPPPGPAAADAGTSKDAAVSQPMAAGQSAPNAPIAPIAMDAGAPPYPPAADSSDAGPAQTPAAPGAIRDLELAPYPEPLRAHAWIVLRMRAASSALPLHAYEVRVATDPITDESSFIRNGRPAKTATDAAEGATSLSLPTDVPAGEPMQAALGNLVAQTHYYVGVRATDEANQHGPIAVAEITTSARTFAKVTPCFVASVVYGSPLAQEVSVLRRLRDRYLLPQAPGRAAVSAYYALGARAAAWIRPRPQLREALRRLLAPLLWLGRALDD